MLNEATENHNLPHFGFHNFATSNYAKVNLVVEEFQLGGQLGLKQGVIGGGNHHMGVARNALGNVAGAFALGPM